MGVFESTGKQDWVISFSEADALNQGARVSPGNTDRGIYAIPGNSQLNGTYHVQRLK